MEAIRYPQSQRRHQQWLKRALPIRKELLDSDVLSGSCVTAHAASDQDLQRVAGIGPKTAADVRAALTEDEPAVAP